MATKLTLIPVIKGFAEAIDVLRALPNKPSEIAALFEAEGIRGRRKATYDCPLTNYVKAHVDLAENVKPSVGIIWFSVTFGQTTHHWDMTVPLLSFRKNFDNGDYPQLEYISVG